MRSDGILLNTVLIIQLVAHRRARAAANPSCTRSQAVAACEFDAWYLCLGGTGGSTTTDDPLAPVAGKTAEDSACYDEGTLADAIQKTIRSTRTRSFSTTTRRVDGPWKRCGPSGKDFRGRVITSWSDPGRRGRMGKRDVITLEVLNSADEWVTRDEV